MTGTLRLVDLWRLADCWRRMGREGDGDRLEQFAADRERVKRRGGED